MSDAAAPMPPKFDAAATETEIFKMWLDEKCFAADPAAPGEPYCIVIPPPNVTGALHLGHAINNTLQDMLIRTHRMKGFNTVWIPGVDHAGIATQAVVEKQLKENENKTRHDVGREGLVERIWQWKQQYGDRIISQLQRMGCSCDWDRTRFTLDDMCARAVRETFFKLFKDGLIFRGKRLVNWDVHLQTSISDDELYTETVKTSLWSIKYPVVAAEGTEALRHEGTEGKSARPDGGTGGGTGGGAGAARPDAPHASDAAKSTTRVTGVPPVSGAPEDAAIAAEHGRDARDTTGFGYITVATTRPETMLADTAVAYHSSNPRAAELRGKFIRLPLTNRLVPLIEDDILVDPEFGTGFVKVTPAHDPNDYAVWQRQQGKIEIKNLMTSDGKVNDADPSWAAYTGLRFNDARKKVVEDLIAGGFMNAETDIKPHEANVSFSDRSKTAIQPYLSDQWFVKMADLAEPALEVVRNGTIKFHPERHAQQYLAWLGEKRDWPVSRQLWWGHRIPVWSGQGIPPKEWTLWEWAKEGRCAIAISDGHQVMLATEPADLARLKSPAEECSTFVCTREDWGPLNAYLDDRHFNLDPDVLDTWFSSALWPHSTLGWPEKTPDLAKWYPGSVLLTGRDIITLWVARMVVMGMYNMGRGTGILPVNGGAEHGQDASATENARLGIPFEHVVINPTILDGKGERMSKSKGNGVDPVEIIDTHGADAMRFTLATMATETQEVRLPVKKDAEGRNTSEKFDIGRNFATKIWNASRFVIGQLSTGVTGVPPVSDAQPAAIAAIQGRDARDTSLPDRWILSRLAATLTDLETALSTYRFDAYAKAVYDFFWGDFCGWYLEAIKPAMKDPARAPATAAVLGATLDASLRILHPIMPFITEAIWTHLNAAVHDRSLPGLSLPPSKRLVRAAWPSAPARNPEAEALFTRAQEIVGAIRNLRNQHKVDLKKVLPVTINGQGLAEAKEIIELAGGCAVAFSALPPADAATVLVAGCEVHVQGVIDPNAEANRLAKRREELSKQVATLEGRLASPAYTDKAPPHLVEQTRKQLADARAELARL
jgi:valyl-tRNA synthetase